MTTMYPAKINSPIARLSASIAADATTIPVDDADLLPDAPNLATIGVGEDCETILYAGKSDDNLTSVTRGFQGNASAWVTGDSIYRAYTAYDHDTFKSNIEMILPVGATAYVIASDAPAAVRTYGTFLRGLGYNVWVCDGTDDDVEIQAATDALPVGGGKVVLSEGTFNVKRIKPTKHGTTIEGLGYGTELKLQVMSQADADAGLNEVITLDRVYWNTIKNMRINGNGANQTEKASPGLDTYIGILLWGSKYNHIDNVWVEDCIGGGIYEEDYGDTATEFNRYSNIYGYYNGINSTNSGRGLMHFDGTNNAVLSNIIDKESYRVITASNSKEIHANNIQGYQNALYGIHLSGDCSGFKASNILIDTPTQSGVHIAGTMTDINFSNLRILSAQTLNYAAVRFYSGTITDANFNNIYIYYPNGAGFDRDAEATTVRLKIEQATVRQTRTLAGFRSLQDATLIDCIAVDNWEYGYTAYEGGVTFIGCQAIDNGDIGFLLTSDYNKLISSRAYNTGAGARTQNYGLLLGNSSQYTIIEGNHLNSNAISSIDFGETYNPTTNIIRNNTGYVTENSGTATVDNGTTSIVVSHGLATTPTRVQITPTENPTNAVTFWWVDTIGAVNFTINVNADPGASNLDFMWKAEV